MEVKQELKVVDRSFLSLNTVDSISCFDEDFVRLLTEFGQVEIAGKSLTLTDLSKKDKTVVIEGEIKDISFHPKNVKSKLIFGGKGN